MAVFDEVLNDTNNRFELNGKASILLTSLLTVITNQQSGSLDGFLELFHRAGLGNVAETWVNSGANTALSHHQLEDALGSETINSIASRSGLSKTSATSALAYMIPLVVDALTPNSIVPDARSLSVLVNQYVSGEESASTPAATSERNVTSTASSEHLVAKNNDLTLINAQNNRDNSSLLRLLLPLLLVGLLAFLGFRFCGSPNREVIFPNANRAIGSNVNTINNPTTNVRR